MTPASQKDSTFVEPQLKLVKPIHFNKCACEIYDICLIYYL